MGNPALKEFQEHLAAKLANALLGNTATKEQAVFIEGDVLRAVEKVTAGWSGQYRELLRDARGFVFGDDSPHPPHGECREMRRVQITASFDRELTDAEVRGRKEKEDAARWIYGGRQGPPPVRVSILRLLDQDEWWRPRDKDPIRVADMDPGHRSNLAGWLRRVAPRLKNEEFFHMAAFVEGPLGPGGDAAVDAAENALDELGEEDPLAWLARKPLFRALVPTVYLWQADRCHGEAICYAVRDDGLLVAEAANKKRSAAMAMIQPPAAEPEYRGALGGLGPAFYKLVKLRAGQAPPDPTREIFLRTRGRLYDVPREATS